VIAVIVPPILGLTVTRSSSLATLISSLDSPVILPGLYLTAPAIKPRMKYF
jgi:hypothetical protein